MTVSIIVTRPVVMVGTEHPDNFNAVLSQGTGRLRPDIGTKMTRDESC